ncbi:nucleoside phosphorylase [Lactiplantibacillus plantarum]|uniref:nucleoside phosphorylase n=1 Tax=Lactiplantibacillus plantarum TaxID=1590 RepID=UPI00136F4835|nr:nucleoside phosphorylase [Lactiplantibacillus plantarum]MBS0955158.1 nucleoside phosphorylase [Lactiplantibacillus plantarum]MCG0910085.1 putative purine nucleoside phosphorylase (putative) [Lactiplantibacillus plantarum]MDN7021687.1 purine-nucleoside phosphorylase [Lactiplantibacillus plantarum]MDN7046361.1 purine-nucleoside phosphorylase [Lactiplantibacillus plantarum]MDN7064655.1 purine-nucleoside phosphorylase [Lactiplantibacillus plantarum]
MTDKLTLLQYDPDPTAMVGPDVDGRFTVPAKLLYIFSGDDYFQQFVTRYHGHRLGQFNTITKVSWVYQIGYRGQKLAVAQAPLGSPAATMYLEMLIDFGTRTVIAVGSCGALTALPEEQLLVPTVALRDEGTSFHYLAAADWVPLDPKVIQVLGTTLTKACLPWQMVKTWTTDAFFRETVSKVKAARQQGCQVVEMECSALAACSAFRQVSFGQLLYTADTLAQLEHYDPRHWGAGGVLAAIELAVESLAAY